jgi:hypothetical protein
MLQIFPNVSASKFARAQIVPTAAIPPRGTGACFISRTVRCFRTFLTQCTPHLKTGKRVDIVAASSPRERTLRREGWL